MSLIHFTDDTFQDEVLNYEGVVMVDFWAPWCGPCQALGPTIEQVANEYDGKAKIGKVNVDEEGSTAQKYMVMSIPTVLVIKNGEVVNTLVGLRPKDDYIAALDANL
jgi:thioredoxin 1